MPSRRRKKVGKTIIDISVSVDGYAAGPNQSLDDPLGERGEELHEWVIGSKNWRESHGLEGGEEGVDSDLVAVRIARTGATIMGRNMFSAGRDGQGWEDDPRAEGWWGEEPPYHHPVFVLTHHEREPLEMKGDTTFTFVTDGIESALEQARAGAGDKDVLIAGGAQTCNEFLAAGLVDEVHLHVAPVLLGGGARLLEDLGENPPRLEPAGVQESPRATHLSYSVAAS
jgi:dihydrofolate reductase